MSRDPGTDSGGSQPALKFFAGARDELIAFVAHERWLAEPERDGAPRRKHLEAAAKQGHAPSKKKLAPLELPQACAHIWTWFHELHGARGGNGFGLNPIGYVDIEAWSRLTERSPKPWEVELLIAVDRIWRTKPKDDA